MVDAERHDERVVAAARRLVDRLEARLGELTRAVEGLLAAEITELGDDAPLQQLLQDTVAGNVATFFSVFRHDISVRQAQPPPAALAYARRLAQRDVSANALIRAYRLGHQAVLHAALAELPAVVADPAVGLGVGDLVTAASFDYIDWISQRVVEVYQDERERWLANRNSVRVIRVRELLDGGAVDADAASAALGYPLRGRHLGAVVWEPTAGAADRLWALERFVHRLADAAGADGPPLFIPVDEGIGWVWLALPEPAAPAARQRIAAWVAAAPEAPRLALGAPAIGVAGFRRTHQQAQAARTVGTAAGAADRRLIAFDDPGLGLAALLAADPGAAAAWVGEVLGPLAADTPAAGRLRETLRVFLAVGSSYTAAGEVLHLHYNTVKYRVQRAVECRGRPIAADRLDVEAALVLCHWCGATMLG